MYMNKLDLVQITFCLFYLQSTNILKVQTKIQNQICTKIGTEVYI